MAELKAFIAERLAPYKRPTQIVLMDALPSTASGKILKDGYATWPSRRVL